MQEFHGHNATNPAGRIFLIRTHKVAASNVACERYYFLEPAYKTIREAATLRDTLLVTTKELHDGYITDIFLEPDDGFI